ncbi:hypothetical protein BaRGS_00001088 [Batillaria attramentaria]|uniref:Uncharacterized protein n=1 Tax=Batillaria attramentaria TaxID=370345 RepID=A0ABD0M7K0_9CAEN
MNGAALNAARCHVAYKQHAALHASVPSVGSISDLFLGKTSAHAVRPSSASVHTATIIHTQERERNENTILASQLWQIPEFSAFVLCMSSCARRAVKIYITPAGSF